MLDTLRTMTEVNLNVTIHNFHLNDYLTYTTVVYPMYMGIARAIQMKEALNVVRCFFISKENQKGKKQLQKSENKKKRNNEEIKNKEGVKWYKKR